LPEKNSLLHHRERGYSGSRALRGVERVKNCEKNTVPKGDRGPWGADRSCISEISRGTSKRTIVRERREGELLYIGTGWR